MRVFAFISTVVVSSYAFGGVLGGMDHIDPADLNLVSTVGFGRVQVFTDQPNMSRMVIDDFFADQSTMDAAGFAYELFDNQPIGHPVGWRISVWGSAADAASSGDGMTGNTIATKTVLFEDHNWSTTPLFDAGSTGFASRIDFTDLGMDIGTGVRYIGIAPIQQSTITPNWYILDNKNPALLGNGTPNNSIGINPGGGLGFGTSYSVATNAAYQVKLVPEPGTLAALSVAAGLYFKKRISNKRNS